ncbi:MAG: hypothetical protein C5B55_06350 [Blastocatellia bacterium]|nr:MAG: hypothetical protein C5B55_06350 [Blastocatellia bacterium]
MRFEFYTEQIADLPKLSVDGTVPNSIHFSHWEGNKTPAEVKADTSTEIALNLVASPNQKSLTKNIELVTNNHFDTDGVLSCWTVLNGEHSLRYRELLIAAAEAGDFSEFSSDAGIRISLTIQGSDQASPNVDAGSPFARFLEGKEVDDDARAYEVVLPEVERLLKNVNEFEPLWRDGWKKISDAVESFERGESTVTELDSGVSLVTLAPEVFSGEGFNPTRHGAPFTAISHYARGSFFVIGIPTETGWFYRLDYPYYSWAETVVRPRVERRNLDRAIQFLSDRETSTSGSWQKDNREMTSALKFIDKQGVLAPSQLQPDIVASAFAEVGVAA